MNEFVTGYIIDDVNLEIGPVEFNMSIKGLRAVHNFALIGMCIRHVEKQEFNVIFERALNSKINYGTTIIKKDYSPDIIATVIITRIRNGKVESLNDNDIELIDGNISIYNQKRMMSGYSSIYSLQISDRYPEGGKQAVDGKGLNDIEKVY